MTSLVSSALYATGAVALGGTLYNSITQPNKSYFKTPIDRVFMHLSITGFVYCSGLYEIVGTKESLNPLATLITGIAGVFGSMRVVDTIFKKEGEKRFDSLPGRVVESATSIGVAIATLHVGSILGISPSDTLRYSATGLSYAAKYGLIALSKLGELGVKGLMSRIK